MEWEVSLLKLCVSFQSLSRDLNTKLLMPRLPEKQQTTRGGSLGGDDYTYASTAMDVQTVDLVYKNSNQTLKDVVSRNASK